MISPGRTPHRLASQEFSWAGEKRQPYMPSLLLLLPGIEGIIDTLQFFSAGDTTSILARAMPYHRGLSHITRH